MLIGILSDNHDHPKRVARALALLDALGAEAFFHCGDLGGQRVLDQFVGRRLWFVWGNTDDPPPGVEAFLRTVGLPLPVAPLRVELAGKRIILCHGHEPEFARVVLAPDADYLFHGHTHVRDDRRVGRCRIINPGALHRADPRTVATLDLATDDLRFHVVERVE